MDAQQSRIRHLAKTLTWRLVGTVDTFLLSWWFSEDLSIGGKIALAELLTKTFLYYGHERAWFRYGKLGRVEDNDSATPS